MIPSTELSQHAGNIKNDERTGLKTEAYHTLKLRIADAAEISTALLLMALCAVLVPKAQCGAGLSFLMLMGSCYLIAGVKLGLEQSCDLHKRLVADTHRLSCRYLPYCLQRICGCTRFFHAVSVLIVYAAGGWTCCLMAENVSQLVLKETEQPTISLLDQLCFIAISCAVSLPVLVLVGKFIQDRPAPDKKERRMRIERDYSRSRVDAVHDEIGRETGFMITVYAILMAYGSATSFYALKSGILQHFGKDARGIPELLTVVIPLLILIGLVALISYRHEGFNLLTKRCALLFTAFDLIVSVLVLILVLVVSVLLGGFFAPAVLVLFFLFLHNFLWLNDIGPQDSLRSFVRKSVQEWRIQFNTRDPAAFDYYLAPDCRMKNLIVHAQQRRLTMLKAQAMVSTVILLIVSVYIFYATLEANAPVPLTK